MSMDVYLKPAKCPHCGHKKEEFNANITHNLGDMAKEAGLNYIEIEGREYEVIQTIIVGDESITLAPGDLKMVKTSHGDRFSWRQCGRWIWADDALRLWDYHLPGMVCNRVMLTRSESGTAPRSVKGGES